MIDLTKLTKKQMIELGKEHGIKPVEGSKATKADWLVALKTSGIFGLGSQLWNAKKS